MSGLSVHDILEASVALGLGLNGLYMKGLRDSMRKTQADQESLARSQSDLAKSVADLTATMRGDYLRRADHDREMGRVWEKMDAVMDKLALVSSNLAALTGSRP